MLFKSQSKVIELLGKTPAKDDPVRIEMYLGATMHSVDLQHDAIRGAVGGSAPLPSIGEQVHLLLDIHSRSAGADDSRAFDRFCNRSLLVVAGEKFSLKDVAKAMDDSSFHAYSLRGLASTKNYAMSNNMVEFLEANALNAITHTGSMETIYLAASNSHFHAIAKQYHNDPNAMLTFAGPGIPSTSGSLTSGVRMVVLGDECRSPQGFIQSGVMMAEQYSGADIHQGRNLGAAVAMTKGYALASAAGMLLRLQDQVGSRWNDNGLVTSGELDVLLQSRDRLVQSKLEGAEYNAMATQLMQTIGEARLRPSPDIAASADNYSPGV